MIEDNNLSISKAILLARFGGIEFKNNYKWLSKQLVSRIVQQPIYKVNKVLDCLNKGLPLPSDVELERKRHTISQEQLEWLVEPKNLLNFGNLSLRRRVAQFNVKFPETKMTLYHLRKVYAAHHIKQRVLRLDILLTPA